MTIGQIRTNRGNAKVLHEWLAGEDGESSGLLFLTVVFTTVPETLAALRRAAVLADELGARIRIFVPYVVPYPLPLDHPQTEPGFKIRQFRTVCEHEPIETRIEIKLCRDTRECLLQELTPQSVLLIGSERRSRFSASSRLARSLQGCGHHVLVIRQRSGLGADSQVIHSKARKIHSRRRFAGLLFLLIVSLLCAVVSVIRREYPVSVAAICFLTPALRREWDLIHARRPRRFGIFEWICLLAGIVALLLIPLITR